MVSRDDDFLLFFIIFCPCARARQGTKVEARSGLLGDEGDDKRDTLRGYFTTLESSKLDDIDLVILRGERTDGWLSRFV